MNEIDALSLELDELATQELKKRSAAKKAARSRAPGTGSVRRPALPARRPAPRPPRIGPRNPRLPQPVKPRLRFGLAPFWTDMRPRFPKPDMSEPTKDDRSPGEEPPPNSADAGSISPSDSAPPDSATAQNPTAPIGTCEPQFVLEGFEGGDYRLRPHQFRTLRTAVLAFKDAVSKGPVAVTIRGHTSVEGGEEVNQVLSFLRATEAKRVFSEMAEKLGARDVTFRVLGSGEYHPLVTGGSVEAKRRNRRVEIAVCGTGN